MVDWSTLGFWLVVVFLARVGPHGYRNIACVSLMSLMVGFGDGCGSARLVGAVCNYCSVLICSLDLFFVVIFVLDGFALQVDRTHLRLV